VYRDRGEGLVKQVTHGGDAKKEAKTRFGSLSLNKGGLSSSKKPNKLAEADKKRSKQTVREIERDST